MDFVSEDRGGPELEGIDVVAVMELRHHVDGHR